MPSQSTGDRQSEASETFATSCSVSSSSSVVITVRGEIDLLTEPRLARHIHVHLRPEVRASEFMVDLAAVTFIGVGGIAILHGAADLARTRNIRFGVIGCTAWVAKIIELWQSQDPPHTWLVSPTTGAQ